MADDFLTNRLTAVEAQIEAAETASASLISGAIYSYTLTTTAGSQTVTKQSLVTLQNYITALYSLRDGLRERLGLTPRTYGAPGW